jgi:O-antigen/teichoic acid export membrane protein
MTAYGVTNYLSGLLAQTPQLLFPILIATQVSPTAAGAFNYAWLASTLLMTLPPSAANVLLAHLVSDPVSAPQRLRRTVWGIIVIITALAGLTYIAMQWVIPRLLPRGAPDTLLFLPLLLMGVVLFAIVRLHSMILAWRENLIELLILNGFVATLAIGLPLILLPRAGVLGLEAGWLLSQFLGALMGQIFQVKFVKEFFHRG